ncbi:MAG: hypothetical protein ACREQ9_22580 [Candidatus Binatia bacterium]
MPLPVVRASRIAAIALGVFGILYLRFSAGLLEDNEVSRLVHWGMLPIALLFAFGAWALEMSDTGSVARRDALWALAGSVSGYAVLRIAGSV